MAFQNEETLYSNLALLLDQQTALITAKTAILNMITTYLNTGIADTSSQSSGGEAGGESWTFVSLNEKLATLMNEEKNVAEAIKAQYLLISHAYPYWEETHACY